MTYFSKREGGEEPYRRLFLEPVTDSPFEDEAGDNGGLTDEGYSFTEEELREAVAETAWRDVRDEEKREELLARRDFYRASVWVKDLALVIVFTAAILLLVWLIVEMISGAKDDLQQNFTVLQNLGGRLPAGNGALHG